MSNTNRDFLIICDVKNSKLTINRPIKFYITDKNTSNIFIKLVTQIAYDNNINKYVDIEPASNYAVTMRIVKPNNETKSVIASRLEEGAMYQVDLQDDCKDVVGSYKCELLISTTVNKRQELNTSDMFIYEVKQSVLSDVGQIIETEDTTTTDLLNRIDAFGLQIEEIKNNFNANIVELDADKVNIKDVNNNYTSENVEGALEEINAKIIKNIFLVNEYEGTDYEKIQNAINACVQNGGGIVLLDGNYTVSNTILLNGDTVSLMSFAGATLTLSTTDENLPLLKVITSDNPHGSNSTCREIKGITFCGTNKKGIGIVFGNATGDSANYTSRDIIIRDCKFYDLNIGLNYTKNAYILTHNHLSLSNCNLCVRMLEGYSNYGERIVFNDTTLCNSVMLVEMSNREGAFYFNNCSFDYSNQFIKCTGGNIYINSSHLEFRHLDVAYPWLIYCGAEAGHGSVIIKDSLLICTNPGSEKYEYLFYCDSGTSWVDSRFLIKVEDCRMIHWKSTSGFLCGGNEAGRFYITNSQLNQIPSIDFKTKANQNLNKMFRVLPSDNDPTLFTWEWVDDTFNDATVKAIKITNKSYLGAPCLVNITLPNLASSVHVDFYIKSVCANECWSRTGYKYSVAGNQYDVSAIPANSAYTQHSLGYFFPINTSTDDFVITLDLNNANQEDTFYVYIENAYQF